MRFPELRSSLRARILALVGTILLAGAAMLSLAAWEYAATAARDAYDTLLIGGAVQIAENIYVQGGVVALDPPAAAFATLSAFDMVFYRVTDPRGIVVAGYDDLAPGLRGAGLRHGPVLRDGEFHGQKVRIAALARRVEDASDAGWTEIVLAQTLQARNGLTLDLTLKALGMIAVMSVLALTAIALSLGLVFAPLTRIETEIARRRPDDLSPIALSPPPEVRALVGAIDGFMRRLDERMRLMQRFIADAAHQIRTPLAAMDAEAELMAAELPAAPGPGPQPHDPAEAGTAAAGHLHRLRERISDLGRLTSQLLDHAMVLHRAQAPRRTVTDINLLAKSVLAQSVPLSLNREVAISFVPAAAPVTTAVDAISLREALTNLIHNALTHGALTHGAPGRLTVTVSADDDSVAISVGDDGPGMTPADRDRLCQPFQKGALSGGSGLGLAIADAVARAHGGTISFLGQAGNFQVRLQWPRHQPDAAPGRGAP